MLLQPPTMRHLLLCLLAITPSALADVEFISPAAGASIPAGAITVTWEDSGQAPAISALQSYTLQILVGGNDPADAVSTVHDMCSEKIRGCLILTVVVIYSNRY